MTNRQIIVAFINKNAGGTGPLRSEGDVLRSYEYRLAEWVGLGVHINTGPSGRFMKRASGNEFDAAYSATTNTHRRLIYSACNAHGIPVVQENFNAGESN